MKMPEGPELRLVVVEPDDPPAAFFDEHDLAVIASFEEEAD